LEIIYTSIQDRPKLGSNKVQRTDIIEHNRNILDKMRSSIKRIYFRIGLIGILLLVSGGILASAYLGDVMTLLEVDLLLVIIITMIFLFGIVWVVFAIHFWTVGHEIEDVKDNKDRVAYRRYISPLKPYVFSIMFSLLIVPMILGISLEIVQLGYIYKIFTQRTLLPVFPDILKLYIDLLTILL
jgi:hypothetical protein